MRSAYGEIIESSRMTKGYFASNQGDPYGAFVVRHPGTGGVLRIIANDASRLSEWWEHVSVSLADRCPTWEEMCWVKDQFWKDDEVVIQIHPKKQDYVNFHPFCLHLWRNTRQRLRLPPTSQIGPRDSGKSSRRLPS